MSLVSGRREIALAWLLLGLTSCSGAEPAAPLAGANVVLIVVDTLRADHLGCYGYDRETSPFLDSMAEEGVLFEHAMSNSSFTRESVSSLFTGRLPSRSGSFGWFAAPARDTQPLGQRFARAGYRTGFFSTTVMLKDPRYFEGFAQVDHMTEDANWTASQNSAELSERALRFVREGGKQPFMLYLHYLDPHAPYDPPADLCARFEALPPAERVALYSQLRGHLPQYVAEGFGPKERRYEDMIRRYDAEIADVDRGIAALCDGLQSLGVLDDTLVVVTADHGEEFLEHGFVEHAWTLYRESLHVPLIFWTKTALEPGRVPDTVSLVDVLPSLVEMVGLEPMESFVDGKPLFVDTGRSLRAEPPDGPRVSEVLIQHRNVARTVVAGDWKLVQAQRWLSPAERSAISRDEPAYSGKFAEVPFDPFGAVVLEELFNLREDPTESRNLLSQRPREAEQLREMLSVYQEIATPRSGTAPAAEQSAADWEKMKALGYAGDQ